MSELTKVELGVLAGAIAGYLPGWTVRSDTEEYRTRYLDGPIGGAVLAVSQQYDQIKANRVKVRGDWPTEYYRNCYSRESSPEITCAISRGPQAIANDINTRLLPQYLDKLPQVLKKLVAHYDWRDAKNKAFEECAAILEVEAKKDHNGEYSGRLYGRGRVSLEINSADSIQIIERLAITVDELRRLKDAFPAFFTREEQGE